MTGCLKAYQEGVAGVEDEVNEDVEVVGGMEAVVEANLEVA